MLNQAEAERRDFPKLLGKHLYLRKTGQGSWEYVNDSTGAVEVRCASSVFARFPKSVTCQGRTYEWQRVGKRALIKDPRVMDLVNVATKSRVLRRSGVHFNHLAGTRITLGGTEFRFPVRGRQSTAVMSATDGSGNHVVEYRVTTHEGSTRMPGPWLSKLTTEVVISPSALTIPHIQLLVAVSSRLIFDFFQKPGGG